MDRAVDRLSGGGTHKRDPGAGVGSTDRSGTGHTRRFIWTRRMSPYGSIARLTDAGAHLVLCRPDKRPVWRGWQKRRPSAAVAQMHVDDAHGPLGVVPWSLRSTALDIDEGDPDALRSWFEPWADLASRRGRHFYYDDSEPRGNTSWSLEDCRGDIRGARGFLVLHGDAGPVRLADALDRRVIGRHPWPRDLFDMAGLGAVLADPVAAPIVAESVCTAAAPIQIAFRACPAGRAWRGPVQSVSVVGLRARQRGRARGVEASRIGVRH